MPHLESAFENSINMSFNHNVRYIHRIDQKQVATILFKLLWVGPFNYLKSVDSKN